FNRSGFLILELVEGQALADRIARGPMPLEGALDILSNPSCGFDCEQNKPKTFVVGLYGAVLYSRLPNASVCVLGVILEEEGFRWSRRWISARPVTSVLMSGKKRRPYMTCLSRP